MGRQAKVAVVRCQGTVRGSCSYPLTTPFTKMRGRCGDCFAEWMTWLKEQAKNVYVIYHQMCDDGFGAAFCFWKVLGDKANYIPLHYNTPLPKLKRPAYVFMVDVTPDPLDALVAFKKSVTSLVVIDHHDTARAKFNHLPYTFFDVTRSGAKLAWDYLYGPYESPEFIDYLQDRDLWLKRMPETDAFTAALRSYQQAFSTWDGLVGLVPQLRHEGRAILRAQDIQVDRLVKCASAWQFNNPACLPPDFSSKDFIVPVVNTPMYQSEIANKLCHKYSQAPFAATYFHDENGDMIWSLRSLGDFHVGKFAEIYHGGGHRNSAGFKLSFSGGVEYPPLPLCVPYETKIKEITQAICAEAARKT